MLHCGAVERPGIAEAPPGGAPEGVAVDLCRAIAVAVLGASARIVFSLYNAPDAYHGIRRGTDAVAFLTGSEIAGQNLGRFVIPGPTVLIGTITVMVPDGSPVQRLADLTGQTVCLMIGSNAQRALESAASASRLSISRLAFEEDVELLDAYNAGNCAAAVGETTYLAGMRQTPGPTRLASRLLPDILGTEPLVAVTPQADGAWAADVAWLIDALMLADTQPDRWKADAAKGLPVPDPQGLQPGWWRNVAAAVGSYAAIIRHNLTERLGITPGPNALWPAGMLMPPAVR